MDMAFTPRHSSLGYHLHPLRLPPNTSSAIKTGITISCPRCQIKAQLDTARTNKKLRPSFFDQIRHKWSFKITSPRETFPWQQEEQHHEQVAEEEVKEEEELQVSSGVTLSEPVSSALPNCVSAPWVHRKSQSDSKPKTSVAKESLDNVVDSNRVLRTSVVKIDTRSGESLKDKRKINSGISSLKKSSLGNGVNGDSSLKRNEDSLISGERDRKEMRSNTELAEKMIPEHELRRLRNISLRMLERFKVGKAGITQALVDSIHDKWKMDEVVKLKFEEPHSLNMRRTHEILESRTGGLVIWRSGSSVVLFRGMGYELPCVQSFTKQNQLKHVEPEEEEENLVRKMKTFDPDSTKHLANLSEEELMDLNVLNYLLDELGPRFIDWTGREPLPVDADLLPPVVTDYKPPFRLLPFGVRRSLRDRQMTQLRRLARKMPPHFALGRNRDLQGLANAMVKLWEKNAIAKIAIKRGVLNTRNERMAEELKRLTGGTLVSRNKDYIVFYRGNDFLPPGVTETLTERVKLADLCQDEEEQAREVAFASVQTKVKASGGPLVAGTLAETMRATSRWGNKPGSEDREEMMRCAAIDKHAALIKHLEIKLGFAKRKLRKAELALAKVQQNMEPAELPSDLETITDEERILFRKMGLSMKPFLLLGRRGVYDGTVENMHMHWKFRELVKIIIRLSSPAQVKQIAISLEAESGGVLVSIDKTTKGYAVIVYRGKNYQPPLKIRPETLLTRRQALAQSIELQRREALKYHIMDLEERIELVKSELEDMRAGMTITIDESRYSSPDDACFSAEEDVEHAMAGN